MSYVAYVEEVQGRRYWQGSSATSRRWRAGDAGRSGAARFPDMHAARAAVAATRARRSWLPRIGYEWLPPTIVQPPLIGGEPDAP